MSKLLLIFFVFTATIVMSPTESQAKTCGKNEVYSTCENGGCRRRFCSQPVICGRPTECKGGCICQDGYTRDKNQYCIPEEQCPGPCNGDYNAEPGCGLNCNKQCTSHTFNVPCPRMKCPLNGCDCKSGYLYDSKTKKCVLPENCSNLVRSVPLNCTGPNEFYACGSACDTTCATLKQACPIINVKCNEKCYCKEGYARDDKNVCIPIEQCRRNINGTV